MRITTLNQIFGMLAVTVTLCGAETALARNYPHLPCAESRRPRDARDAGRPTPRRYDADQLTERSVAPTIKAGGKIPTTR